MIISNSFQAGASIFKESVFVDYATRFKPRWVTSPLATTISWLPPVGNLGNSAISEVPSTRELGYEDSEEDQEETPFRGGESEALRRLTQSMANKEWVANFEKPKGDPSAFLKPATTVLSPYLKFGCLSSRYFYQCLQDVEKAVKKHTSPPVSLLGQGEGSNCKNFLTTTTATVLMGRIVATS